MKIAMPYQDGVLLEHFGRAKEFIIYNVSDLDPVTSEVIAPEDLSHAAVARALKEHGVDVVLCGSIGEHARQAVEGEHMLVFSGITGAADDVLERFLQGNLEAADGDFAAEGGCGGCGGGCASGGCAGCSGCADPKQELMALMKYMVGHNTAHANELAQLAKQLQDLGENAAYEQIMLAVSDFEKGNLRLSTVLTSMNG